MVVLYNQNVGDLTIVFTPRDIKDYALMFEFVFEDERQMGTRVPGFKRAFFNEFLNSREKISITFSCDYLEFCISFLEEVWIEMKERGNDTTVMEQFLDQVGPLCCYNDTLH